MTNIKQWTAERAKAKRSSLAVGEVITYVLSRHAWMGGRDPSPTATVTRQSKHRISIYVKYPRQAGKSIIVRTMSQAETVVFTEFKGNGKSVTRIKK